MSPHRGQLRTGGQRHGLWDDWTTSDDLNAAEAVDNPRAYLCRHCGASANSPCVRVGSGTPMRGYHPGRGHRPTHHDGAPPAVHAALARLADSPQETDQ